MAEQTLAEKLSGLNQTDLSGLLGRIQAILDAAQQQLDAQTPTDDTGGLTALADRVTALETRLDGLASGSSTTSSHAPTAADITAISAASGMSTVSVRDLLEALEEAQRRGVA